MNNNRPLVDRLREALALPKIGPCFTSADFTTPEDVGITKENARLAPLHDALLGVMHAFESVQRFGVASQIERNALAKLEQALAALEASNGH